MNELKIFDYEGSTVRTLVKDGELWWVLKDVCGVLDLSTPARVAERLDEDEVSLTHLTDSLGRQQETSIINEPGLYKVILRSDKPEAKAFSRWVTHEVLPSIRKTGSYSANYSHDIETVKAVNAQARILILLMTKQGCADYRIAESVKLLYDFYNLYMPVKVVQKPTYEQLSLENIIGA